MSNNLTFRLDSETERMLNELVTYYLGVGTLGGTNKSSVVKEAIRNLYMLKIGGEGNNNDVYLDVMKTQIEETMKPIVQRFLMETDTMVERVYLAEKILLAGYDFNGDAPKLKKLLLDETKEWEKAIELKINDKMEV